MSYFIIAGMLTLLTLVLVLVAAGFDIDRRSGQVIQNGVLLLETEPELATVYINDQMEADVTPSRFALPQGDYTVRLELEDYRDWQSDVEINGSQVTWLYYPQLIPNVINTSNVEAYQGLRFVEMDDKAELMVTYSDRQRTTLRLHNVNTTEITSQDVQIPERLFSKDSDGEPIGAIKFIEWSSDSSLMLLRYRVQENTEYWVVNLSNPSQSSSIDKSVGISINDAFFGPRNNDIYIVSGDILRQYNISSRSASTTLFSELDDYGVEDRDVWVQKVGSQDGGNGVYRLGSPDTPAIAYDSAARKSIIASNYESKPNLALVGDGVISLYTDVRDEFEQNVPEKTIRFTDPNTKIEFAKHGRFLAVTQSNKTLIYDLETQKEYNINVDSTGVLGWLDANRLYYSKNSQLHVVDFTGENTYPIANFVPKWGAYVNEARDSIFTIGEQTTSNRLLLHRSLISLE